jgi:hypothetical protein
VDVQVTLQSSNDEAISGASISLTSSRTDVSPASGATTDSTGTANFTLSWNGEAGTSTIIATFRSASGDTFTNQASVTAEDPAAVFNLDIQKQSGSTFSDAKPLTVIVALTSNGAAVANQPITLESQVGLVSPKNNIAITNSEGLATFAVAGDSTTRAGLLTASYKTPKNGDLSDAITVQMLSTDQEANFERVTMTLVGINPADVALRNTGDGTGLKERSEVTFQLTDPAGNPIANQPVSFELSSTLGGIELLQDSVVTDANGLAVATVWAGTVPATVRVFAETEATPSDDTANPLRVSSDKLTISPGIATQQRFTIIAEALNPADAAVLDGVSVPITAYLFDRFGSPVPDGTTVTFVAECGGIDTEGASSGACQTKGGSCTVNWISQNLPDPRPDVTGDEMPGFCSHGRASILAYALGEEDYSDNDSSGFFEAGSGPSTDTFSSTQDNSEAFLDANESGRHEAPEFFVDWADNDAWDSHTADPENPNPPGKFNGAACLSDGDNSNGAYNATDDCFNNLVFVSDSLVLVPGPSESIDLELMPPEDFSGELRAGQTHTFTLGYRADGVVNIPPVGTSISVGYSDSGESGCNIRGTREWIVPNSNANGGYAFSFFVEQTGDAEEDSNESYIPVQWHTPAGTEVTELFHCTTAR